MSRPPKKRRSHVPGQCWCKHIHAATPEEARAKRGGAVRKYSNQAKRDEVFKDTTWEYLEPINFTKESPGRTVLGIKILHGHIIKEKTTGKIIVIGGRMLLDLRRSGQIEVERKYRGRKLGSKNKKTIKRELDGIFGRVESREDIFKSDA